MRPSYNPQTYEAAAALAADLGYLPLALAIARAHAWSMGWSFAQYREHFFALPPSGLLERNVAQTKLLEREQTKGVDYPRSITATFTLAIEKAKASAPEAERLLAIAAYLAPDRIPLDIVTAEAMSEIEKGEAVAALAEVSLVTRETLDDGSPAISVHRLVQEVMRRRLGEGAAEAAALATRLVADAYPSGDPSPEDVRSWPACRRLEAHAAAVLAFAPDTGEPAQKTSRLLNQYALHLDARADYAQAEPLYRRALALDEKRLGPRHPDVARALNNLAMLLQDTNRLAEAEPLMRRALAIDEESLGPGHPNVAIRLNNLAALLQATNRLAEAEPLMRRVIAIFEESFGPGHPDVASALNNLAQLLQDTNRLVEAEPLMRRALAIKEASLPDHHPSVQLGRENLKALLEAIEAAKQEAPEGPLAAALSQPHPPAEAPAPEGKPGKAGLRGEEEPCPPQSAGPVPHGERAAAPRRGLFARWFGRG